jgi:hypothetical protein
VDWFDDGGNVEWRPGATHCVVAAWAFTCGLPPRNKEITMSSMLRVIRCGSATCVQEDGGS